jgi:hypothetical protein
MRIMHHVPGLSMVQRSSRPPDHSVHPPILIAGQTPRCLTFQESQSYPEHQSFCWPATIEVSSSTCELSFCTNSTRSATLAAVATGFVVVGTLKRFETWGSLVGVVGASREDLLAARMLPTPAWQADSGRPGDFGSAVEGGGMTLCETKRLLFSYAHMIATNGK